MSGNTANRNPINLFSYPSAIVHIDCDAFFTSCEQALKPSLKEKVLVTGGERGIVACPSYLAKSRGIKRGMMITEARKVCPEVMVLESDYESYSLFSTRMFSIIRRFTPEVEEYSIDEAFCDITGLRRVYRTSYENIALRIKDTIEKELGITVSVGLSSSRSLAKICSKHKKPAGFTAVPGYKLHEFLPGIPLDKVCGFGSNTVALLEKHGLKTVMDFVKKDTSWAENILGKIGRELHQELRGLTIYVISNTPKKNYLSISKTKTFTPPSNKKDFVKAQLFRNLELALAKARRFQLSADRFILYLKTQDHRTKGIEGILNRHSASINDFSGIAADLFEILFKKNHLYRATGVALLRLKSGEIYDRTLFDDPIKILKYRLVSETIDHINYKYGSGTIHTAASLRSTRGKYTASPQKTLNIPELDIKI